jgi:hypothetical protein
LNTPEVIARKQAPWCFCILEETLYEQGQSFSKATLPRESWSLNMACSGKQPPSTISTTQLKQKVSIYIAYLDG